MPRPDWNTYFMNFARLAAQRSTCLRRQVGAVIVRENMILATGYNGAPKGLAHCAKSGCIRQQRNIPSGERAELCRGCLHGDTVIKLLDGTYKTIKTLANDKKAVWVYAVDTNTGEYVPVEANVPVLTGYQNDFIKITFDNGKSLVCTPDHKILMRDLSYVKASDLRIGLSVYPLYYHFKYNNGYESIKGPCGKKLTHWLVYSHAIGIRQPGNIVHHNDTNVTNNLPINLQQVTVGQHSTIHNNLNPRPKEFYKEISKKGVIAYIKLLREDGAFRNRKATSSRKIMQRNWESPQWRSKLLKVLKSNGILIAKRTNSNPICIHSRMRGKIIKGVCVVISKHKHPVTVGNYEQIRKFYGVAKRWGG